MSECGDADFIGRSLLIVTIWLSFSSIVGDILVLFIIRSNTNDSSYMLVLSAAWLSVCLSMLVLMLRGAFLSMSIILINLWVAHLQSTKHFDMPTVLNYHCFFHYFCLQGRYLTEMCIEYRRFLFYIRQCQWPSLYNKHRT